MKLLKPLPTEYADITYRSRTEARWAVFFDMLDLMFEYEREGYDLGGGDWYLPDFWLPQIKTWVEVKGDEPTPDEWHKCRRLADGTGRLVLSAVGSPAPVDQLLPLFPKGSDNHDFTYRCRFAEDRRNEREYWLLSGDNEAGLSIGPVVGPDHDRYPLIHRHVEAAYDASRNERFARKRSA